MYPSVAHVGSTVVTAFHAASISASVYVLVEPVSVFLESELLSVVAAGVSLLDELLAELLDFWEVGVKSDGISPADFQESKYCKQYP